MSRLVHALAAASATLVAATPALSADYTDFPEDMRPAFGNEWESNEGDPLGFEFGVRYWYSKGSDRLTINSGTLAEESFESDDTSHIVEGHLRIDDYSTRTYVKALAGYAVVINGDYSTPDEPAGTLVDGRIGYAGADFGYTPFGDPQNGAGFGFLGGYQYWNESPNVGRGNFTTATSQGDIGYDSVTGETFVPMDSEPNNIDIHALRLGVQGRAELGGMFDINAELAAIPYAWVNGSLGAYELGTTYHPGGNIETIGSSVASVNGWGYGGSAELMLGVHPTENLTVRLGGRAWYLQGNYDATFSRATIGMPSDSDLLNPPNFDTAPAFANEMYISTSNPFSFLRYGALFELTYKF